MTEFKEQDYERLKGAAYGLKNQIVEFYVKYGANTYDEFIEYLKDSKGQIEEEANEYEDDY